MKDLLKRGIAVHHSGILPIIKEVGGCGSCIYLISFFFASQIIEMLFAQGLVRVS